LKQISIKLGGQIPSDGNN